MEGIIVLAELLERSNKEMFNRSLILVLLAPAFLAVTTSKKCEGFHTVAHEVTRYDSPNYPDKYPAGSSCKMKLTALPGYHFRGHCTIKLPPNDAKNKERFFLAMEDSPGSLDYYDDTFINLIDYYTSLVVGHVSKGTQRGKYTCYFFNKKKT